MHERTAPPLNKVRLAALCHLAAKRQEREENHALFNLQWPNYQAREQLAHANAKRARLLAKRDAGETIEPADELTQAEKGPYQVVTARGLALASRFEVEGGVMVWQPRLGDYRFESDRDVRLAKLKKRAA